MFKWITFLYRWDRYQVGYLSGKVYISHEGDVSGQRVIACCRI